MFVGSVDRHGSPFSTASADSSAVIHDVVLGVFMKVFVLGGDGFCGWPPALHLSDLGHEVTIVDNLSRRKIDVDLEVESLTPIAPIGERLRAWRGGSGGGGGVGRGPLA